MSGVPGNGELRIGSVALPAGKQISASYYSGEPIAWATVQPVPHAGRVWAALSAAHPRTGLVPFLLSGRDGDTKRPWDDGEFNDPENISSLDQLDARQVLASGWYDQGHSDDDEDEDGELAAMIAPFSGQFPGLAPAADRQLSPGELEDVLGSLPAARIGLTDAARPADVLPRIGWLGATSWHGPPLPIAAVLRSWEDRFGARLLDIGFAEIRLLVDRPPRRLEAAQRIAAEHFAFCDECGGKGLRDIPSIAVSLVNAPIWTFWWD